MANLDSSIARKSSGDIDAPLLSSGSSFKVLMPRHSSLSYQWPMKFLRVSSPLKLKKTSYFHWGVEDEPEPEALGSVIAISRPRLWQRYLVIKSWATDIPNFWNSKLEKQCKLRYVQQKKMVDGKGKWIPIWRRMDSETTGASSSKWVADGYALVASSSSLKSEKISRLLQIFWN